MALTATGYARADMPRWLRLREERATADDILRRLEIFQPPVDVASIAERLDVRLRQSFDRNGDPGRLISSPESAEITVNAYDSPPRQRFTVAHELGHLFLHPLGVEYRGGKGDPKESQANVFAGNLLMPFWMLRTMASVVGGNVDQLARIFQVSPVAMKIQVEKMLGLMR